MQSLTEILFLCCLTTQVLTLILGLNLIQKGQRTHLAMLCCASNPKFGGSVVRRVDNEAVTAFVIGCLQNKTKL